jgi:hypothetical protein
MNDVMTGEIQNIIFNNQAMEMLFRLAETMAQGTVTVPNHLRGKSGDCLAICMQAAQWRMNPFAVAQKTHVINGALGYEAQLVNAAISSMAPTKDRLHFEWFGHWEKVVGRFAVKKNAEGKEYRTPAWSMTDEEGLGVNVWATLKGEESPRALTLLLSQARTRNSTLWADDPRQQLAYLGIKRWARLYCPDVILGVYTADELEVVNAPVERDITQHASVPEQEPEALSFYPAEKFEQNFLLWEKAVIDGRRTTDDILNMASSKGFQLSAEQRQAILNIDQQGAAA